MQVPKKPINFLMSLSCHIFMIIYNTSRYADQLSIGNEVLVQGNNQLTPVKVITISTFTRKGEHSNTSVWQA